MVKLNLLSVLVSLSIYSFSQNDLDAVRYSRQGINGSSRFVAMGGAFGAVGADVSCAAYNPAGLGLFRKGEISFSGALRFRNNNGFIYDTKTPISSAAFAFDNFGLSLAWKATSDEESRNVIAFTNTQIQNFSNSLRMAGYTNSSSIAKDMLMLANEKKTVDNLNSGYEWLGFDALLLDTVDGKFISLLDTKRTVMQSRDIVTAGRVNELNFSYAYSYKDKYYFGVSLGIPRVEYTSTTTHIEQDDKDSMRIGFTSSNTYTSTFIDGLPLLNTYYNNVLAFNSLTYTEYFKTQGSGVNIKLGGVARINDIVRLGFYYHSPTLYNLNDTYYNKISTTFDYNRSQIYESTHPENGGYFQYRIITPSRIGLNSCFVIQKRGVIGLDYELTNYRNAQLGSDNVSDFIGVNALIKNKYSIGHTIKLGGELNVKPMLIRFGYLTQGSPFGNVFSGQFVRNTLSFGFGFRSKSRWYIDFVWARSFTSEDYFLFTELTTKAKLNYASTTFAATVGIKF
jgi:hypothetical protein